MNYQKVSTDIGVLIGILIVLGLIGGGLYFVTKQNSSLQIISEKPTALETQAEIKDSTAPAQSVIEKKVAPQPKHEQVTENAAITITSPLPGTTLKIGQQTNVQWSIPSSVVNSFPHDFNVVVFLYVIKQGDPDGVYSASIGDGHAATAGATTWKIQDQFEPGTYKIFAQLQATPKDQTRMCDPIESTHKDCTPNKADQAVVLRAAEIKGETSWFTIKSN